MLNTPLYCRKSAGNPFRFSLTFSLFSAVISLVFSGSIKNFPIVWFTLPDDQLSAYFFPSYSLVQQMQKGTETQRWQDNCQSAARIVCIFVCIRIVSIILSTLKFITTNAIRKWNTKETRRLPVCCSLLVKIGRLYIHFLIDCTKRFLYIKHPYKNAF